MLGPGLQPVPDNVVEPAGTAQQGLYFAHSRNVRPVYQLKGELIAITGSETRQNINHLVGSARFDAKETPEIAVDEPRYLT
jgi:hypothetical protein